MSRLDPVRATIRFVCLNKSTFRDVTLVIGGIHDGIF